MGKIRKFFGLFACLFTIFLTASAFAATNVATGFDTCTDQRVYTSCSAGYTLTGGTCVVSSGGGGESGGTSNWGGSAPGTDEQTGNNWVGECAPSQYEDASGNCVCPSGTTWANNECVMQSGVTCPANQVLSETYGYCTCPDSTAWDGSTCVSMPMGACYPTYYIEPSTTTCTNCAEFAGTAYPQFHDITRITLPGHVGGLTPSASGYKYSTAPCVGDGCRAPALMGTLLVNNDSYSWNTNDGVIFTGWNTSADGTGTHYAPGEYIDCSSPKVYLYAQWRAPTCAYTNGVAYTSGNVLYGTNYTHCVGHCDAGYDVNGGVISNSDADVNMGGLITSYGLNGVPVVTGECIPGQYNITLDPNGGSGGTSAVTARYMGTMVVQSIETPTQDGYNFRGYYRNQDGTGTKYYDEDGVATSAIWSETTYGTLYAKWEAEGYQIKYNINNAHLSYLSTTSGAVPSTQDDCQIGVPCTIAGRNTLWNDKYVFAGWNTYSGVAMGVEYPIGSTNSITRDQDAAGTTINLYAAWIEPNCVANNVQSAVPTVDSNNKVTCDIYCADGFSVTGGTDTNRDGELVGNPNIVTVSAGEDGMCKPRVFTVELDPNGGTAGSTTSVTVEFGSAMTEQLTGQGQLPTYAGKTFTGFFDQYGTRYYNADGTPYTNTTYANYNIDTLYAQWEDAAYTVQYDITTATGGTAPADTTCSFGVACTLAGRGDIYNSTKIFVGWKDASGTTYDAGETITKSASDVTNGVIVLTPNWAETTCTINYGSSNGKSVSSENKLTCTGICTNGYSGVSETSIDTAISATGNAGETSVTADCIPRKTTLRFIKNTSTSDNTLVTTTTLTHGAAWTNLSFSQPTRTGYTLKGWYTSRDGGGTPMYNADGTVYNPTNVQNLTWTGTPQATSTVNLYAVWTPNVLTITLNKNASDATAGTGTVYLKYATGWYSNSGATTVISTVTTPTRTGYTFDGYYTNTTGGSQIIDKDGVILDNKTTFTSVNYPLYAHWTPNTYRVVLNVNGGTTNGTPSTVYLKYATGWYSAVDANGNATGSQLTSLTSTPEYNELYNFNGYTITSTGGDTIIDADGNFVTTDTALTMTTTNGTSIYAQWVQGGVYVECSAGYYVKSGTTTCTICPANNWCPGVARQMVPTTGPTSNLGLNACDTAGGYGTSGATGKSAQTDCKKTCTLQCTQPACPSVATECTYGTSDKTGTMNEVTKTCSETVANTCPMTVTCPAGYTATNNGTANADCVPNVLTITLDKNASDATAGTGTVYLKYATGWYSNAGATTVISTVTTPTRTGYTFDGYYTGNTQIIDRTGAILSGKTTFTTTNATLTAKWTAKTMAVTFNANCSGVTANPASATYAYGTNYNLATVSNNLCGNSSFAGWQLQNVSGTPADETAIYGAGAQYTLPASLDSVMGTATLQFVAQWSTNTCTVTNGTGTVSGNTCNVTCNFGYSQTGGTDTKSSFTQTITNGSLTVECKPITLYTVTLSDTVNNKTQKIYKIHGANIYYSSDVRGSTNPDNSKVTSVTRPTASLKTFGGYFANQNGVGTQYIDETGAFLTALTNYSGNMTIYAQFTDCKPCTSTDSATCGNVSVLNNVCVYTATCKEGYDTVIASSLSPTAGASAVTPQCTPKVLTITLNKNASDATAGTGTVYLKYATGWYSNSGATTAISTVTTPTRTGYAFDGYYTTGNVQIIDRTGAILSGKTTFTTTNATLTAKWTPNTYTVKFDSTGGSTVADVTATYAAAMPAITAPTRTGYKFLGFWDTDATSGGNQYYTANGTSAKNWDKTSGATLYARWSANTYTVKFDSKGGSAVADVTATYAAAMPAITAPTRTGYTFLGFWDTDATSGGNQYYTKSGTSAKNWDKTSGATLYARWSTNTYTVTLDPNGGTAGSTTSVTATYNANLPTIAAAGLPTRTGYTFAGYWDDASGGEQYYDASGTGIKTWTQNGGGTLYAHWTANTYTVKFDSKGGSTVADVTATYAAAVPTITAPKRTGYKFLGFWDTDATSGGNQYYTESGTSAKNWDKASGATLYARWSANTYTVKFDSTGGSTVADVTATYAAAMPAITAPTRTGYTFEGYWDAKTGGNQYYTKSGTSAKNWDKASGATLYARWNANTYTVNLMPNWPDDETLTGKVDANPTNVSLTYAVGWSVDKLTSKPDVLGYDFQGYYTVATATGGIMVVDKNGNFQTSQDALTITTENNATVYARWTNGTISCPARTYYAGTGTACTECTADHYCPGVETVSVNNGQIQGRTVCPDGGKSDAGAAAATECHKIVDYKAEHGSGHQDCYYDGSKYATGCRTKTITKCDAGYWLAEATNEDCSEAGYGKYSVADSLTRTDCPNNGKTTTTTSGAVTNCYLAGLACTVPHGNGRQTCYHNDDASMTDASAYNVCEACVVDTCDDGYENKDKKECVGCLGGTYCKGGIKTDCPAGHPKSDNLSYVVTQCYRDCLKPENAASVTGRVYSDADATSDGVHTCQTTCAAGFELKPNDNSDLVTCVPCEANYVCPGENVKTKCSVATGDELYRYSATGTSDKLMCYAQCELAAHAETMQGFNYYSGINTCAIKTCEVDYELYQERCAPTKCPPHQELVDHDCIACAYEPRALTYLPDTNCMVDLCEPGYHAEGRYCIYNVRECEAPHATDARREWNKRLNGYGSCIIHECEDGYHIESNACVQDMMACEIENGTGIKTWDADNNAWGECSAAACAPGYTDDPSLTDEKDKRCGRCKNAFDEDNEIAASSYVRECEIASCMYQGEKYALEDNQCVLICEDGRDDETGTMHWNASRGKCERTCKAGFTMW